MRMLLVGIVVGGVLGAVAGFAGGIFIYPFWFLTDVATEEVADRAAKTAVARGAFVHANPSIGLFGCSIEGLLIGSSIPIQLRTESTSPNGTPVWAMPQGPGFIPINTTRFSESPNLSR